MLREIVYFTHMALMLGKNVIVGCEHFALPVDDFILMTSCGAGHNKPRPLADATDSELCLVITNNLTFDPPTRLPELTQN